MFNISFFDMHLKITKLIFKPYYPRVMSYDNTLGICFNICRCFILRLFVARYHKWFGNCIAWYANVIQAKVGIWRRHCHNCQGWDELTTSSITPNIICSSMPSDHKLISYIYFEFSDDVFTSIYHFLDRNYTLPQAPSMTPRYRASSILVILAQVRISFGVIGSWWIWYCRGCHIMIRHHSKISMASKSGRRA